MSTLKQVISVLNPWEEVGKAFFNRMSNGDMVIHIRDPRLWGGNPNIEHWQNAREIYASLEAITKRLSDIKIDQQSSTLVLRVYDIYNLHERETSPDFDKSVGE